MLPEIVYINTCINSRSNAHCDGAPMAPLCKVVKRGAVRANDLPLSNDLEAWPDSSVGRALDVQSQGSRVRIPLGSVIFSHFHFSFLSNPVAFTVNTCIYDYAYHSFIQGFQLHNKASS